MTKATKILCIAASAVFTVVLLLGLTVAVIEKTTDCRFFINETLSSFRISPFLVLFLGAAGDAAVALTVCIRKKAKRIFAILAAAVLVFSLFAMFLISVSFTLDRYFYYEKAPDGNHEIVICNYQFLVAGGGEVYSRVNPLFIRKLYSEDGKHAEWFYEDYTVEWRDGSVTVDGHTYLLP